MPKKTKAQQRVRAVCGLESYEHFWIEYDVSSWGMGVYTDLYLDMFVHDIITKFIPQYSTGWHMENSDRTAILHPGPHASLERWKNVWKQFDAETSRVIHNWLAASAYSALAEAMSLRSKSAGDDSGDGAGAEGDGDGGES